MANKIWLGNNVGNEGDWGVAANWQPGGVPINNDDVIFDGTSNEDVTGTLDQSAVTLDSLVFAETYTGQVGGAGTPLLINSAYLRWGGQGDGWIEGTIPTVYVTDTGASALTLDGTITTLHLCKGTIVIIGGATCTNIFLTYVSSRATDATLTIGLGCTISSVWQDGGILTSASTITTYYLMGGTGTQTTGNIITATIGGVSTFYWQPAAGTITTLYVWSGSIVDASGDGAAKTITTATLYKGGILNIANGAASIVVTNPVLRLGGELILDEGRTDTV